MRDAPVTLLAGNGSRRLESAALERAAAVICPREGAPHAEGCSVCRRIANGEHPDLLVAAPERRRRVHVPAFSEATESKETTLPAALVRAIVAGASRAPYEAAKRAIVLLDVDRTEAAAFSALLKVLEEPPPSARFILTATRERLLPATILSRVALEKLPSPRRSDVSSALVSKRVSAEEAEARAAFAPEGVEEAESLDLAAAREKRDAILAAASGVFLSGSTGWALALAGALAGEDAEETGANLNLLGLLLRDSVASATDPSGGSLVHRERFADLARLEKAGALRLLEAAERALSLASTLGDSPRNPRLAVEAFALSFVPTSRA